MLWSRRPDGSRVKVNVLVGVLHNPESFPEIKCVGGVLQAWELSANDLLCSPDSPETRYHLTARGWAALVPYIGSAYLLSLVCVIPRPPLKHFDILGNA